MSRHWGRPLKYEHLAGRIEQLNLSAADLVVVVLDWSRRFSEATDTAVVKRYGELMQEVTNPLVREVFAADMDVRMIMAALRRRRHGLGPPTVGFGQWVEHIRRHFNQPDFRLGHVFPWILPFAHMLEQGDVLNLYRRVLGEIWVYLKKRAEDYDFSFEAVVLYIARWDIIRHWQQLQAERGRAVFEPLITEALGEYAELYA